MPIPTVTQKGWPEEHEVVYGPNPGAVWIAQCFEEVGWTPTLMQVSDWDFDEFDTLAVGKYVLLDSARADRLRRLMRDAGGLLPALAQLGSAEAERTLRALTARKTASITLESDPPADGELVAKVVLVDGVRRGRWSANASGGGAVVWDHKGTPDRPLDMDRLNCNTTTDADGAAKTTTGSCAPRDSTDVDVAELITRIRSDAPDQVFAA